MLGEDNMKYAHSPSFFAKSKTGLSNFIVQIYVMFQIFNPLFRGKYLDVNMFVVGG